MEDWDQANVESDTANDGPLGGLALYDSPILNAPDIDLVALEVRWTEACSAVEASDALAIRDAIEAHVEGLRLPVVEPIAQKSLTVAFAGESPKTTEETVDAGHQLRAEDQSVVVAVLPHALSIQMSQYERWSVSARPILEAALNASIPMLRPSLVARIGLRYVNRIEDDLCVHPTDWNGKIAPALIAPYLDWGLQKWVRAANQAIEFEIDEDHRAVLRHGVFYQRTGVASDYLLDIDIFSQRTRSADAAALVESFTRMNRTSLAIFQQSINFDYLTDRAKEGETR
jgi:uncharacterized protein (TIGR04255 family)